MIFEILEKKNDFSKSILKVFRCQNKECEANFFDVNFGRIRSGIMSPKSFEKIIWKILKNKNTKNNLTGKLSDFFIWVLNFLKILLKSEKYKYELSEEWREY